eukprot:COSAG02_NODE_23_length_52893_cov_58.101868_38_plen_100_part_00
MHGQMCRYAHLIARLTALIAHLIAHLTAQRFWKPEKVPARPWHWPLHASNAGEWVSQWVSQWVKMNGMQHPTSNMRTCDRLESSDVSPSYFGPGRPSSL